MKKPKAAVRQCQLGIKKYVRNSDPIETTTSQHHPPPVRFFITGESVDNSHVRHNRSIEISKHKQ